jgi:hypothetical protein
VADAEELRGEGVEAAGEADVLGEGAGLEGCVSGRGQRGSAPLDRNKRVKSDLHSPVCWRWARRLWLDWYRQGVQL